MSSFSRPAVDVVVPFYGSQQQLREVLARLDRLQLGPRDTLTVVDNRPAGADGQVDDPRVVLAPEVQSAPYSRNAGAFRGNREWILFIDADVEPAPDVVDQYFVHGPPAEDVAVLAGAILDQEPPPGTPHPAAARYMFLRKVMSQTFTKAQLGPFAKTANAAFRRSAFEAVDGFQTNLFCGEDVDICYRLAEAGWRLEFRDEPVVEHIGRESVKALLRQWAKHGTSVEWLDKEYPGFSPPFTWRSLVVSVVRGALTAGWAEFRGDHDRALIEVLDPLTALAFHLGRLRSNYVPTGALDPQAPAAAVQSRQLPISVVVPVFNRADRLERALASVRTQRHAPLETIVIDDGSTDTSGEVAAGAGARVIKHASNRGQAAARNTGIEAATQPWVAFLDSDDEWLPGHLEGLWELRHRVQFVASSSINCRPDPARDRIVGPLTRDPTLLRKPWRLVHPLNFVTTSAVMARRDAILAVGGFRAYGQPAEDLDLWLRLLELGPARLSPRVSVVYHVHGLQLTGDMPRLREAHLTVARACNRDSWPASLINRHEGAHAWDQLRDALLERHVAVASRSTLRIFSSPTRLYGVLELLARRVRARRATARVRRDGGPTVALLVNSSRRARVPRTFAEQEREDLRGRSRGQVLLRLARRPAGLAITDSPARSLAAQLLAIPIMKLRANHRPDDRSGDGKRVQVLDEQELVR
jgi:glycosyltransferase involved in cell wall biosynthesis